MVLTQQAQLFPTIVQPLLAQGSGKSSLPSQPAQPPTWGSHGSTSVSPQENTAK